MVSRSVWDLSDPRPRLRVFLSPYQPEAKPRADMETETPETKAKGLINPIQTYLPCYKQYIVMFMTPFLILFIGLLSMRSRLVEHMHKERHGRGRREASS